MDDLAGETFDLTVRIASGERSRRKVVRVAGVTAKQFWERLSSQ